MGLASRLSLFLNHACNLRCSYCYNGDKFHRAMPLEVARRAVDLCLGGDPPEAPFIQISFFGGEPLLELELIKAIVTHARLEAARHQPRRNLGFHVITNGTLLGEQAVDYLLGEHFFVAVSLDGCRTAQDATRRWADGSSSHDVVVANLERLIACKPLIAPRVVAVVDPGNVDRLAESFEFLIGLGVRNLAINVNYEGDWDEDARARFQSSLRGLGDAYLSAYRRKVNFSCDLLDAKIITGVKGGYACGDRCDFGRQEIAVSPRGRLYPCDRLVGEDRDDDVVIGDLDHGIDAGRRDALIARKDRAPDGCADCDLLDRCRHWCGCVNHATTGSVGEVSGLVCWFEQQIIEAADRCAAELHRVKNPLFMKRFYAAAEQPL